MALAPFDARLHALCALYKDRCDTTVAMADWAQAHYADVIALDTVGSPRLLLVEGEGMVVPTPYDEGLKDVIAAGAFAAVDRLPYTRRGKISFSVECQASGTLGTAPQWGKALQACAFSETVTATTRVDYLPASSALKTATIWAYVNGRLEKFLYAAGTVKLSMKDGQVPTLDFEFINSRTDTRSELTPSQFSTTTATTTNRWKCSP